MATAAHIHDRAAIVSSGDEIMLGQLQDTNARWLAEQLVNGGIKPVEFASVGDDASHIAETLRRLARRVPLIIMSGGLGPTEGDLTRHGLAAVLGDTLIRDDTAYAELDAKLRARGRSMNDAQARQSLRPSTARCLHNAIGTAPGLHAVLPPEGDRTHPCEVLCLPGPPNELKPMWAAVVATLLRPPPGQVIVTRLLTVVGVAESDLVRRLGPLMARDRSPLIGVTASDGVLTIRIRCEREPDADKARALVADDAAELVRSLGVHVVSDRGLSVPAAVLDALREQGQTLATVESCTGGMLGQMLTDVPGSSAAYFGGWVTYSNDLKTRLVGVPTELIARHGAVSREVALAMAVGGLEHAKASSALAITGIAGPDGGTRDKPVGTVWVALARRAHAAGGITTEARRLSIPGSRSDVRRRAAGAALTLLWIHLAAVAGTQQSGQPTFRLLWESTPS